MYVVRGFLFKEKKELGIKGNQIRIKMKTCSLRLSPTLDNVIRDYSEKCDMNLIWERKVI